MADENPKNQREIGNLAALFEMGLVFPGCSVCYSIQIIETCNGEQKKEWMPYTQIGFETLGKLGQISETMCPSCEDNYRAQSGLPPRRAETKTERCYQNGRSPPMQ